MLDQVLVGLDIHLISSAAGGVTLSAFGMRTGGDSAPTPAPTGRLMTGNNTRHRIAWEPDPHKDGHLFQIDITSTVAQTAAWSMGDMILTLGGPEG
jgi:hypothetical protein